MNCRFCNLSPDEKIYYEDDLVLVFRDSSPVSPGHSLAIPKRHVQSFFDTTKEERDALLAALDHVKAELHQELGPDAYNIGVNDGPLAGQSVPHLHIHLIPRFEGDREDPRGGVRWVIPEKAPYWKKEQR